MRDSMLLAALEARRTAPIALLALTFATTFVAARFGGTGDIEPALLGIIGSSEGLVAARGATRASAATLGIFLVSTAVVLHASGLVSRWRSGDGDWIGARPVTPHRALASAFAGIAVGAIALLGAVLAATALSGGERGRALAWRAGPEAHYLIAPGETYRTRFTDVALPAGGTVRVRLQNTALDLPFGDAELSVALAAPASGAADSAVGTTRTVRIARRGYVEVELPAAPGSRGDLEVALAARGPGSLALVGPHPVEVHGAPLPHVAVEAALAGRALALLIAAAALGVAFGAWIAPSLAALLVLASLVAVHALLPGASPGLGETLQEIWPGYGIAAALDVASSGRTPMAAPPLQMLGLACVTLGAGALAHTALGSWRHAP